MLPFAIGWAFFFSGFSKMQGVPLSWHRRQGACVRGGVRCGAGGWGGDPGRAEGRTRLVSTGTVKAGGPTHVSFAPILAFRARRAGTRTSLGDVARGDLLRGRRGRLGLAGVLGGRGRHLLGVAVRRWAVEAVVRAATLVGGAVAAVGGRRGHRRRRCCCCRYCHTLHRLEQVISCTSFINLFCTP